MKRIKKFLSMMLAMVMIMGMSVTAFAEGSPKITVQGTTDLPIDGATIMYAQVIEVGNAPEYTKGWKFVNDKVATAYKTAFGVTTDDEAIQALITANGDPTQSKEVNSAEIKKAISLASTEVSWNTASSASFDVTGGAGVYLVKIAKDGYNFTPMAAYVGFGEPYPELPANTALTAKGSAVSVQKTNTDSKDEQNNVVAIGDSVTFTITTQVPYVDPTLSAAEKKYYIFDTITGADYDQTAQYTITMNGEQVPGATIVWGKKNETTEDAHSFYIDLSSLILDNNANMDNEIVVTYSAKVTEVSVTNTAKSSHSSDTSKYGQGDSSVYTGSVTLLKYGDSDTSNVLSGAGFNVTTTGITGNLKFVAKAYTGEGADRKPVDGAYVYKPTATDDEAITKVVTDSNGEIVIEGLDLGTYHFTEVEAPTGYSINADGKDLTIGLADGKTVAASAADVIMTTTDNGLNDTRLSPLPSTGGIGTTIFTLGGCAIMIIAAGLYFATRRRTVK